MGVREKLFMVIAVIFGAFILLGLLNSAGRRRITDADEKYSAKNLLSENEKKWFAAFKEAFPNAHVLAQVALNQLVKAEGARWRSAKNKIDPRSIDFVLLSPDLNVLMAVEIDDKSHRLEKRRADDEKKNKALRDAGIILMRFPALPIPTGENLKKTVVETIAATRQSANTAKTT
jgi:very-short-patch-repair endonuclease